MTGFVECEIINAKSRIVVLTNLFDFCFFGM